MIVPLMFGDYNTGKLDVQTNRFKLITGIASLLALGIPIFGFNPIKGQIITQVFVLFALPLVVLSFLLLWNRKAAGTPMKKNRDKCGYGRCFCFLYHYYVEWLNGHF